MTRRVKVALSAALIPVAFAAGLWLRSARPWESATQRTHRLCAECGWARDEVDWLIDANKHSTLTREESLELFRGQFNDETDAEYCEPCVSAVLDAAEGP